MAPTHWLNRSNFFCNMSFSDAARVIHGPLFKMSPLDENNIRGQWRAEWNFASQSTSRNKLCLTILATANVITLSEMDYMLKLMETVIAPAPAPAATAQQADLPMGPRCPN